MDNNNPGIPQVPVVNTPPVNPQPQSMPQAPIPAPSGGSNRLLLWFVIGLVLIILLVGGIYLYLSRQQAATTTSRPVVAIQTTAPVSEANLDEELSSVNVENTADNDLAPVDQNLNQL